MNKSVLVHKCEYESTYEQLLPFLVSCCIQKNCKKEESVLKFKLSKSCITVIQSSQVIILSKTKFKNISHFGINYSKFTSTSDYFYSAFPNCLLFCSHLSQFIVRKNWNDQSRSWEMAHANRAEVKEPGLLWFLHWLSSQSFGKCQPNNPMMHNTQRECLIGH